MRIFMYHRSLLYGPYLYTVDKEIIIQAIKHGKNLTGNGRLAVDADPGNTLLFLPIYELKKARNW